MSEHSKCKREHLVNWLILSKLVLYLIVDSKWPLPREQMHSKSAFTLGQSHFTL